MTESNLPVEPELEEARRLGHEFRDIHLRGVATSGAVLIGLVAFSMLLMWWLLPVLSNRDSVMGSGQVRPARTGVDQTVNQQLLRISQQREQRKILDSYGWVDRQERVARIPIERAIAIMKDQGEVRLPSARNE